MKQARAAAFDVITVGAATRDIFVRSSHFESIPSKDAPDGYNECFPMGAKIDIDSLVFETGGGATNTAVTFARFGLKVACVSRVAPDANGYEIVSELKQERINTHAIQFDKKRQTACSIIILSGTGSRAILTSRGASKHIDEKEIDWDTLQAPWMYLTSLTDNQHTLSAIFAGAKQHQMQVAWNPGHGEIELGLKKLLPHLMQTDVLIMNREEAAALAETSSRDWATIAKTLGSLPRMALIISDGKNGAMVIARGITWHVKTLVGKTINTTGAGDAFGSGFIASIMRDGDIVRAMQVATLNAHGVVTHMGAKAGILKKFPSTLQQKTVLVRQDI